MDYSSDFGGLFSSVGHFFSNAAKVAGKEIGHVTKTITDAGGTVSHAVSKVPVVGAPVSTIMSAAYHAAAAPAQLAVDVAIKHRRIDHAVLSQIKTAGRDLKAVAPYAKTVIAAVPGVGTGAAAAIGAGLALAEGQPIDHVMLAAVTSAVPGGPIAQSAARVAAHGIEAAVHGNRFDAAKAAGEALSALPVPPAAKNALQTGVKLTADLASGKKVDPQMAEAALAEGMKYLPPDAKKALQTGLGVAVGKLHQEQIAAHLPEVHGKLLESGLQLAKTLPVVGEARALVGSGTRGFDLGHGLLAQHASMFDIVHTRSSLKSPDDVRGFDTALATRIGLVAHPATKNLTPAAHAGQAITFGLQGMPHPGNKQLIMQHLVKNPSAAVGAKTAVQAVSQQRKSLIARIVFAIKKALAPH